MCPVDDACFVCDCRKGAVAVVLIEHVGSEIVDIDVQISIVVVVAHGHPQTKPRVTHAGLLGDIRKPPIPVVAIERISGNGVLMRVFWVGPAEEVDVDSTVSVVVK